MANLLGSILYFAFLALLTIGTGLGVAALHALLARPAAAFAEPDARRVRDGRRAVLRRWGMAWLALTAVWLAAMWLLQTVRDA